MTKPQSPTRAAVEAVLREAVKPLSPPEIAVLSGLTVNQVRSIISYFVNTGKAKNAGTVSAAAYVWLWPVECVSVSRFSSEPYAGTKFNIRDGGEDHKDYGSRRGEEIVPWAPMISMCGSVEAVGGRGK